MLLKNRTEDGEEMRQETAFFVTINLLAVYLTSNMCTHH